MEEPRRIGSGALELNPGTKRGWLNIRGEAMAVTANVVEEGGVKRLVLVVDTDPILNPLPRGWGG